MTRCEKERPSLLRISQNSLIAEEHCFFWQQHPALLVSLTLLIGVGTSLFWQMPWNALFPLLWCLYLFFLKKWPVLFLLPAMIVYCHFLYRHPPLPGPTMGLFSISTVQPHQSPFAKGWVYQGTLHTRNRCPIPCDIYTQGIRPSQRADKDYFLFGTLCQRGPYQYFFKPKQWAPIARSWSFAHFRYLAKERYRCFLFKRCARYPRAARFLTSLTTGDVDDRQLKYEFGKLGLQHLLAISGFHFGILIAMTSFILSFFFSRFWKCLLLLFILTGYYLFVGPLPSVQRSWLTATLYLLGKLFRRNTSGLNLLGVSLGFEILLNPLVASHLGFQFSFSSTGGLLVLYPILEKKLRSLLPKRPSETRASLSLLSKHLCLFAALLRNASALTLSVNAAILPILLAYFHTFPLLSLLYNLFYPCCIGVILSLLFLALVFHLLMPPVSILLFSITSCFTSKLLEVSSYPPSALDYPLLIPRFPAAAVPFCLFFLLLISIRFHSSEGKLTNTTGLP